MLCNFLCLSLTNTRTFHVGNKLWLVPFLVLFRLVFSVKFFFVMSIYGKLFSIIVYHSCEYHVNASLLLSFFKQMGAHDIEEALAWKKKIELLIDQV